MKSLLIILLVPCLFGCYGVEPQKTGKEGKPIPNFSLLSIDSVTRIRSHDIPTGQSFVLLYFSPYCPYCKDQTKNIIDNINILKNIHFYFISSYPLPSVKAFFNEFHLHKYGNITVGLDSAHLINNYFEVPVFPYLAIYGKNKNLKKCFLGKINSSQIKNEVEE